MLPRINYLDGLRGVAILLVLGFHAYARWPHIMPYGGDYIGFPLFGFGWVGVQLFFLISGFVIFMTLDKTANFGSFLYKRLLRLYPAMVFASLLIYFTASLLYERPGGSPDVLSLIPGLTLIEPGWWSKLLGVPVVPLEGVFWSLYVEFKFYILAGLIYFYFGRAWLIPSLFLMFISSIFFIGLSKVVDLDLVNALAGVCRELSFRYFGWFCSGAIFYMYQKTKIDRYYYLGIGMVSLSAIFVSDRLSVSEIAFAFTVTSVFWISLKSVFLQGLLSNRVLIFFGFVSYPLYLIHENAMVSLTIKLYKNFPDFNLFFYPFIPIMILTVISFFIAKECEPRARRYIQAIVQSKGNRKL